VDVQKSFARNLDGLNCRQCMSSDFAAKQSWQSLHQAVMFLAIPFNTNMANIVILRR
jgi:hypothetical protein